MVKNDKLSMLGHKLGLGHVKTTHSLAWVRTGGWERPRAMNRTDYYKEGQPQTRVKRATRVTYSPGPVYRMSLQDRHSFSAASCSLRQFGLSIILRHGEPWDSSDATNTSTHTVVHADADTSQIHLSNSLEFQDVLFLQRKTN